MKLSLILTGAERHADMQRFFQSLLVQHEPACTIEVIFVNQGTFEPPQIELAARGITLREIRTGRLPLSKARNIGLAEASGDLFAFPDDDCWYPERLLADVMAYLALRPEVDVISTNVFDPTTQRAYGDRPVGLDCKIHYGNLFQLPISVGIFVHRNAFDAAGFFFDEQIGAGTPLGSGEETDLVYRLLRSGSRIEYLGTLQVYHPVPVYVESDVTKYYKYGLWLSERRHRPRWGIPRHQTPELRDLALHWRRRIQCAPFGAAPDLPQSSLRRVPWFHAGSEEK